MDEAPFVERKFALDGGELVARFYPPAKAPGGEFQCRWSIAWPGHEVRRYACGEDGVQALMLAMRSVHSELVESDPYKAGRLTLWDQTDLDLPPTWGAGPLYDVLSPNEDVPPLGPA
ncbi:MAG TPA: hypothetical protein VEZ70_11050 [Allosphingosinicella sp.]|nr:hypothetical protein [Allosphingosinicella sp.]